MSDVATQLMFQGDAAKALDLYDATFGDFRILERDEAEDGTVRMAKVEFGGHRLNILDTQPMKGIAFNPAQSLYVEMHSEEALDAAFEALADGGKVLMPLGSNDVSPRFGWLIDRYGLSWQVSLVE